MKIVDVGRNRYVFVCIAMIAIGYLTGFIMGSVFYIIEMSNLIILMPLTNIAVNASVIIWMVFMASAMFMCVGIIKEEGLAGRWKIIAHISCTLSIIIGISCGYYILVSGRVG